MNSYYAGRRARHYNTRWRTYTRRTLAEVLAMIDFAALRSVPERQGHPPRVLDIACGTGILLKELLERVPNAEAYGVDASADMFVQASAALKGQSHVHLEHMKIGSGEKAGLPYAPGSFDLITCTNMLHYMPDPTATLEGLRWLLALEGQLVLEDFARREFPFPWAVFEGLIRRIDAQHVRAYTLKEAQSLCQQSGLHVASKRSFAVDWLWHGWVICTYGISSISG